MQSWVELWMSHCYMSDYWLLYWLLMIDYRDRCMSDLFCVCCLQPLCQPYLEIASAYNSHNPSDLRSVVTRHNDIFVRVRGFTLLLEFSTLGNCILNSLSLSLSGLCLTWKVYLLLYCDYRECTLIWKFIYLWTMTILWQIQRRLF